MSQTSVSASVFLPHLSVETFSPHVEVYFSLSGPFHLWLLSAESFDWSLSITSYTYRAHDWCQRASAASAEVDEHQALVNPSLL